MIILITGGTRSGKSNYAQKLALELSSNPVYVATAKVWDEDFKLRVDRHKSSRDDRWVNIEEQRNVSELALDNKVAVVDCVTLWLSNFFSDHKYQIDPSLNSIRKEIDGMTTKNTTYIIITNEIGMGVHAETEIGRKFTDLQGWANQYIASVAHKVILMVSGIPVIIKDSGKN
ncbi:MAG: adenosylcobinamide kinase/adenosylcobinamide phosphate guanyltransferase [Bacteroidetes bacterium]|nr:MAG: adenosylcobinamide kinase/adenosylcobinamide phosphate guanyltransferase [Bacteroidota bacterium]